MCSAAAASWRPERVLQSVTLSIVATNGEQGISKMSDEMKDQHTRLHSLHKLAFCGNLGFAIGLTTILLLLQKPIPFVHGRAQSPDLFRQMTIQINTLFHRVGWDLLGTNVALTSFAIVLCLILLVLLKVMDRTIGAKFILGSLAGITAVVAVPIAWTPYVPVPGGYYLEIGTTFWYAVVLEFALVAGALYLTRTRRGASWFLILMVHYAVWAWFLVDRARPGYGLAVEWLWPLLLSLVAPFAGLLWVLYVSEETQNAALVMRDVNEPAGAR